MKKIIFLSILNAFAFGLDIGSSNLDTLVGYPSHSCSKPYIPYRFSSEYEFENTKSEVENYLECIKEYIEAANNDIKRIEDKKQEAIDEAKDVIREFNYR